MTSLTYTTYELKRTFRNRRFFFFSLAFPLLLFLTVGGSQRGTDIVPGVPFLPYYMVGMAGWGAMSAVIAGGGRISMERAAGWVRLLRLTPLSVVGYFRAKIVTAYLMALLSLVLLFGAGLALGVRLPVHEWAQMTGLILVALVPMAVLGILLGHLLNPDSMGPVLGGLSALLAFLGGSWFVPQGWLATVGEYVPSYWLTQAGRMTVAGGSWPAKGWLVIAVWTVALTLLAARVYRREEGRG
jgi:ABC-2 type transport system permease protein